MEQKVVFVTGGSSGIGLSVCKALHARGCRVYEISRREVQHTDIIHIGADVANEESVRAAASYVTGKEGKIDILINNAGYGISGAVEFTDGKDAKRLFDVDFFGMDSVTRAVLPVMRQNGGGRIVNISSVAAALPIPFQTYYSAVKAAVSAYSLALADEVRPFGIEVLSIMPGDIRTGFTAARIKSHKGDDIYGGRMERSVSKMERDEERGMSCDAAGERIARIALAKNPGPICTLGAAYRFDVALAKILPTRLVRWIVRRMYG